MKKRNKKYNPNKKQVKPLNLFQIEAFINPLEDFIKQIEEDGVFFDGEGKALMSFPNEDIEEMAMKGIHPRYAVSNISSILECYFQITAYCFSDENIKSVTYEIREFTRKILNPIKSHSPIQKTALEVAKRLCENYKALLRKCNSKDVVKVAWEIDKVVQDCYKKKILVTEEMLREWMYKEKGI